MKMQTYKVQFRLFSLLTLALWQLRQTRGLLLIISIGVAVALVLVSATPIYSEVATSAGLQVDLTTSQRAEIDVQSLAYKVSSTSIEQATRSLNTEMQKHLGSYLLAPQFSARAEFLSIQSSADKMNLVGVLPSRVASRINVLQGRIPSTSTTTVEIAITPETATALRLVVGSILGVSITFQSETHKPVSFQIPLHIAGIFTQKDANAPYWLGASFEPSSLSNSSTIFSALVPNESLLYQFTQFSQNKLLQDHVLSNPVHLSWYYPLDISHIYITNLDTIMNEFINIQADDSNNALLRSPPFLTETSTYIPNDTDLLQKYHDLASVTSVPVRSIIVLILGLVLFFVSVMMELLVERHENTIALLRSRGASQWQIFIVFLFPGIGINLLALVIGPLLAFPLVYLIARLTLPNEGQQALGLLATSPVSILLGVGWLPLLVVLVSLLLISFAIIRALSTNILSQRRETARSHRFTFLRYFRLDALAALLALVGFGFSAYLLNAGVLDDRLRLLLLSPLTMFEAIFLLLAFLLLALRLLPLLWQTGAAMAKKSRGATLSLTFIYMVRASREPARMVLMLVLAIAFAIFSLIFAASQAQRLLDVATYQVGADFMGNLSDTNQRNLPLQQSTKIYSRIPGVISASVGFTGTVQSGDPVQQPIALHFTAVDANTFAQTALWPQKNGSQLLHALMTQLIAQRKVTTTELPAIVDATTWNTLHLTIGKSFVLSLEQPGSSLVLTCRALAEVDSLPSSDAAFPSGVLVDYQTYMKSVQASGALSGPGSSNLVANTVWLRTRSGQSAVQSVRKAVTHGDLQLTSLLDRRAIIDNLGRNPLHVELISIMALGAIMALLLAFVGNLVGAWLRARARQTNFAVLHALGASSLQIIAILNLEQYIIYITALVLGVGLGFLFSVWAVPLLVFTSVGTQGISGDLFRAQLYANQSIPPVQLIVPSSLIFVLGGIVLLCLLSLIMMVLMRIPLSVSQRLRLNED